ncbi:MAG: hypothetical protein ACOCYG_00620 [Spirochaetota bacterium]
MMGNRPLVPSPFGKPHAFFVRLLDIDIAEAERLMKFFDDIDPDTSQPEIVREIEDMDKISGRTKKKAVAWFFPESDTTSDV